MFFQTLSNKIETVYWYEGEILNLLPKNIQLYTWSYNHYLKNYINIDYLSLYEEKSNFEECIPNDYWDEYSTKKNVLLHNLNALANAKIDINISPWWNLIPYTVLDEYCNTKNKIFDFILKTKNKPSYYDLLYNTCCLLKNIEFKTSDFKHVTIYDMFGTITGRLVTRKPGVPVLTMSKIERKQIKPSTFDGMFLSLDYNAFEVRVLLGLVGENQPYGDLHTWNNTNIFKHCLSKYDTSILERQTAKKKFFAWLYSNDYNEQLESVYKKNKLIEKFYKNKKIINGYGKEIECDKERALNYLIQSTAAFLFYEQALKIYNYLISGNYKSFIRFLIHDDIVIDLEIEEKRLAKELVEVFANTRYGYFPINVKIGTNLRDIKVLTRQ